MAKLKLAEVLAAAEESIVGMTDTGFCIECGAEAIHVEPDARGYTCAECDKPAVYGAEEILLQGLI